MTPNAPADKSTLIRRVTFDLTGLPPTEKEIEDFLTDTAPVPDAGLAYRGGRPRRRRRGLRRSVGDIEPAPGR